MFDTNTGTILALGHLRPGARWRVFGFITGIGSLTKTGGGTLILSGENSYSTGTTVSAGTLQGTSRSLQGAITNDAAVIFDQSFDGTYAGDMTGTGTLTKNGSGSVILTGTSTSGALSSMLAPWR